MIEGYLDRFPQAWKMDLSRSCGRPGINVDVTPDRYHDLNCRQDGGDHCQPKPYLLHLFLLRNSPPSSETSHQCATFA